jgi:hypothetical protein
MDSLNVRLLAEELGERITPTVYRIEFPRSIVGLPAQAAPASPTDLTPTSRPATLTGTYSTSQNNGVTTYHFTGQAHIPGRGRFLVTGTLSEAGAGRGAWATGRLVLSNARGGFVIALRGANPVPDRPQPSQFRFRIETGSGAFLGVRDTGRAKLDLNPGTGGAGSVNTFVMRLS